MEVELIFKIAAVGILVAVLNILLSRSGRDEQALMTTIAALVVVLIVVVQKISELFELIKIFSALMEIVIKASAIAAVSAICILLIKRTTGRSDLPWPLRQRLLSALLRRSFRQHNGACPLCYWTNRPQLGAVHADNQMRRNCYNRKDRLRSVQGCRAKRHRLVA